MNFYSIVLAVFRLIAVCVGCYYSYVLVSALVAPSPEFMNSMQAQMMKYQYDQTIRQSIINICAALTLYCLAPLLAGLIMSGGNRRRA